MPRISKEQLTAAANRAITEQLPDKYQLALYFNVTVRTVDRWVASRKIPAIRLGPRCTRFEWPAVKRAISRLVVEEIK